MSRRSVWLGLFSLLVLAHDSPGAPAPGAVTHRVACASDPSQTYSVFLPSAYASPHRWPVLFVFDPRGRGATALEVFREAAEQLGWIVVSSDNTASDGPIEPNQRALSAMWDDVPRRYAIDGNRVYAAGFSGTVAIAWALGVSTRQVAGVIGVGGRMPTFRFDRNPVMPLFAAAGDEDFNWLETRDIVKRAAGAGAIVRFERFSGGHEWFPPSLASVALSWFELLAMKARTRPVDRVWITEALDRELAAIALLERQASWTEAVRRAETAVTAFSGLGEVDVSVLRTRADGLSKQPAALAAARNERRWDGWERQACDDAASTLRDVLGSEAPVPAGEAAGRLRIAALRKQGAQGGYKAEAAKRVLSWLFIQVSYYIWKDELDRGAFRRAALLQEIAAIMSPNAPAVSFRLGLTLARAGDVAGALGALRRSAEQGLTAVDRLEGEPAFARLRESPEFAAVLARVRQNAVSLPSRD